MNTDLIKAHLNVYAVLQNLEDLVKYDPDSAAAVKNWDCTIQFVVKGGPRAFLEFKNGVCTFGRGVYKGSRITLYFLSPAQLNAMMDGKGGPIPSVKALFNLGFLMKEFPKVTDKLAYYLKPTDELLKDKKYLELNTRFTLNTAAFGASIVGEMDPTGHMISHHMKDGVIEIKILPNGPAMHITLKNGAMTSFKGGVNKPTAQIILANVKVANDFLSGKCDLFAAIATGEIAIKGIISTIDALALILERISLYIS